MINTQVLEGLNSASKTPNIYAYLQDSADRAVYQFLFNPEEKRFSRRANYNSGVTALSSTPSQQYEHTTGLTLQLSNLLLQSFAERKTCKLLLQRLQSLMVADPANGRYSPTTVFFTWGNDKFGPAVITSLDWSETAWLDGQVAEARVNLTLQEVPNKIPTTNQSQSNLESAPTTLRSLTNRQKTDASNKAIGWLRSNLKRFSDTTKALISSNRFKLLTLDNGTVNLTDTKGKNLGVVGVYKDGKLDTKQNTLIRSN